MTFHDTCALGIVGGVRPRPPPKKKTLMIESQNSPKWSKQEILPGL